MFDLDAIATINIDQLATATDRLLLGALRKRRPHGRGTAPTIVVEEETVFVRARKQPLAPARLGLAASLGVLAGFAVIAVIRCLA